MPATRLRAMLGLAALVLVALFAVKALQWESDARLGATLAASARPGDVRMISSVTCVYCAAARAWLAARRVPFSECLIERDADCAAQYRALQSPGTPVLLVRGQRQVGFDARAVASALSAAGDRSYDRSSDRSSDNASTRRSP